MMSKGRPATPAARCSSWTVRRTRSTASTSTATINEFLSDAGQANGLSVGPKGELYAVSSQTGKVMSYDASGKGSLVVDGLRGRHILATPAGGLYVTSNGDKPEDPAKSGSSRTARRRGSTRA